MNGDLVGAAVYDARIETKTFFREADTVERRAQQMAQRGGRSFKNFSADASTSFDRVSRTIGAFAKVAGAALIGGSVGLGAFIKQAAELQSIRASFESMTGSAERARQVLAQLNKFSFETAFSTQEINKAAQLLLGAGLEVKNLGKYMKAIGDVAGATGADLGMLTLPLSQSLARGKLQTQDFYQILNSGAGKLGQELRRELAERGIGDFNKAMEDGLVTSDILFDVIQKSAKKGGFAFKGAIRQAETFDGRMSNLMETIGNVGLEILGVNKATGEIDPNGVFARLSNAVKDATKWLTENKQTIRDVSLVLVNNAIPVVAALAAAFTAAKVAAIGFGIAAMTADQRLRMTIVGGIITLIGALTFLQVKFNIFGKAWDMIRSIWGGVGAWFRARINDIVRAVSSVLGPIVAPFRNALGTIKAVFRTVTNAIIGPFKAAFDWVRKKWNELMNSIGATDVKGKVNPVSQKVAGSFLETFPITAGLNAFKKRARGGPVASGQPYLVGENPDGSVNKTTELFVPGASGMVYNAKQLQGLIGAANGGAMSPTISDTGTSQNGSGGLGERVYNIGTINIAKEADGERWLRKLTGNQEIISNGLVPTQQYGA